MQRFTASLVGALEKASVAQRRVAIERAEATIARPMMPERAPHAGKAPSLVARHSWSPPRTDGNHLHGHAVRGGRWQANDLHVRTAVRLRKTGSANVHRRDLSLRSGHAQSQGQRNEQRSESYHHGNPPLVAGWPSGCLQSAASPMWRKGANGASHDRWHPMRTGLAPPIPDPPAMHTPTEPAALAIQASLLLPSPSATSTPWSFKNARTRPISSASPSSSSARNPPSSVTEAPRMLITTSNLRLS